MLHLYPLIALCISIVVGILFIQIDCRLKLGLFHHHYSKAGYPDKRPFPSNSAAFLILLECLGTAYLTFGGRKSTGLDRLLVVSNLRAASCQAVAIGCQIVAAVMAVALCNGIFGWPLFIRMYEVTPLLQCPYDSDSFRIILAVVVSVVAWMVPPSALLYLAFKRRRAIRREVWNVLMLFKVMNQIRGSGLLQDLEMVAASSSETCPILSDELKQVVLATKYGAGTLAQNLQAMAQRCDVGELTKLTSLLTLNEARLIVGGQRRVNQVALVLLELQQKRRRKGTNLISALVTVTFFLPAIIWSFFGPAFIIVLTCPLGPIVGAVK